MSVREASALGERPWFSCSINHQPTSQPPPPPRPARPGDRPGRQHTHTARSIYVVIHNPDRTGRNLSPHRSGTCTFVLLQTILCPDCKTGVGFQVSRICHICSVYNDNALYKWYTKELEMVVFFAGNATVLSTLHCQTLWKINNLNYGMSYKSSPTETLSTHYFLLHEIPRGFWLMKTTQLLEWWVFLVLHDRP